MTENSNCSQIRFRLNDQRNDLMAAHYHIIPARQDVEQFERQVSDLERQIQNIELQAIAGRAAPSVLGPGGFAVSALNSIETNIRIGRLNDELGRAEANLRQAENHLEEVEKDVREYEGDIRSTEAELVRSGCN